MKNGIHLVDNLEELAHLRQLTIGQSDFEVHQSALAIDAKDQSSLNLGYYQNGKLVAALRFYPVNDYNELEKQLDYPGAHQLSICFPGVVVGKAGSLPEVRGQGLIRELFVHGLRHYEKNRIGFAALTTKPTNRLNDYIQSMGFIKSQNSAGWHRFGYNSHGETFVFLKRFDLDLLCRA